MKDIEDSLWFCFPPRGPQAQIALVVRIEGGGGWQAGGSLRRVTSWLAGCGAPQVRKPQCCGRGLGGRRGGGES